jgi:hypothetical protein
MARKNFEQWANEIAECAQWEQQGTKNLEILPVVIGNRALII